MIVSPEDKERFINKIAEEFHLLHAEGLAFGNRHKKTKFFLEYKKKKPDLD